MTGKLHRDFLAIPDFSKAEYGHLFALAERMRAGHYREKPLSGKSLGTIFMKASTRTR
ncbi:MAG: ornithine carbamoyltransferase, partial [Gemmatimonadaceae bacterium]